MHIGGGGGDEASPAGGTDPRDQPSKRQRMALDAAAGAAAGCVSRVVVGPLDVIKIRFQVQLEPIGGGGSAAAGAAGGSGGGAGASAAAPKPPLRVPGALPPTAAGAGAASSSPLPPLTPKYRGLGHAFATILREEGVAGLWRGTVPGVFLAVPYTAVQFVALQQVRAAAARWLGPLPPPPPPPADAATTKKPSSSSRRLHLRRNPDALPPPTPPTPPPKQHPAWVTPAVSFASGALAGAAGTVASYPFDLLRTTLAAQGEPRVYNGMLDAARGICRTGGPKALYRGLGVTLVEIVPYAALQFGLYDALNAAWRDAAERRSGGGGGSAASASKSNGGAGTATTPTSNHWTWYESDRLRYFACGLAAGLAAKLATHPLDVAKKRYQVAGLERSLSYGRRVDASLPARSLAQCLGDIWRREGARGLWKGSVPSVVKAAPAAAVTFVAYEAVAAWLLAAATAANAAKREREEARERQQQQKLGKGGGKGGKGSSPKGARGG